MYLLSVGKNDLNQDYQTLVYDITYQAILKRNNPKMEKYIDRIRYGGGRVIRHIKT